MINNSGGALLTEVFGPNYGKKKKKDKKNSDVTIPIDHEKKFIFPGHDESIHPIDEHFFKSSNILPYDDFYMNEEISGTINNHTQFFPYKTHTLEGTLKKNAPSNTPTNAPSNTPTNMKNNLDQIDQWVWDDGIKISKEDFQEFQEFKKFKENQKLTMNNQQFNKSQNIESFGNINDDFNDVLLFGLLGIFFLIFTDYIYKLGRKSY